MSFGGSIRRALRVLARSRPVVALGLAALALGVFGGLAFAQGREDTRGLGPEGLSKANRDKLKERKRAERTEREHRRMDPEERAERRRSRRACTGRMSGASSPRIASSHRAVTSACSPIR